MGSTNSSMFFDFVRGSLIPTILPLPDKHSITVMNNCSIHHVQEIKDYSIAWAL